MENFQEQFKGKYAKANLAALAHITEMVARGELTMAHLAGIGMTSDECRIVAHASELSNRPNMSFDAHQLSKELQKDNLTEKERQIVENLAGIMTEKRGLQSMSQRRNNPDNDLKTRLTIELNL